MRRRLRRAYLGARAAVLAPLAWRRARAGPPATCRRILLVRMDRIGDLVLTTPFLQSLRDCYPDAEVVLLGRRFAQELLAGRRLVDRLVTVEDRAGSPADPLDGPFDLAIDLHYDYLLRPALLARRANAACSVGFDIGGRGVLFDIPVPASEPKHFIEESLDILRALGHRPKRYPLALDLGPEAGEQARRLLAAQGVDGAYAIIHPGGHYPEQRWPAARFAALADSLPALGLHPILLGAAAERPLVDEVSAGMRIRPPTVCGAPLGVSAAAIGASRLFIGNNSGPLHIACALEVPSVSTMGPTDPVRFWPASDRAIVVRGSNVHAITPADMAAAVRRACPGSCSDREK
ncbi:MAG: glycosyltransferase family 9 protein [Candidatus Methylomirabilales bacterium]